MQAEQPLTEDLYREKGKENPGQAGYGGSNARASLAFPTAANHRSRTGRPVFIRAACVQVSQDHLHRTAPSPSWTCGFDCRAACWHPDCGTAYLLHEQAHLSLSDCCQPRGSVVSQGTSLWLDKTKNGMPCLTAYCVCRRWRQQSSACLS